MNRHIATQGEFILYRAEDGKEKIEVRLQDETVWLSQAGMAFLFDTTPQSITMHIKNIYQEEELSEFSTCKEFLQVRQEGNREISIC